jgi:hypothetical protein
MDVGWEQVNAHRLARSHLDARVPPERALEVASAICGLHAQVMSSAALSLWARIDGLDREALPALLWEDRALVKTWAMRGTLHLLPTAELPMWLGALATYRERLTPGWFRAFEITPEQLERFVGAVAEALEDRLLTRRQLSEAVLRITGDEALAALALGSWGSYLKSPAYRGLLCFGPASGRDITFTNPSTWVGSIEPLGADEALDEVARRFLAAYGPATREDFARWWAVSPAAARKRLARVGVEVSRAGEAAWALEGDDYDGEPRGVVNLLPAFDPYVIGVTKHSTALMPGDFKDRVHRQAGWVSPVLLVDGRIQGVWRHERRGRRVEVTIEPFRRVSAAVRRAAAAEAERLARFLGSDPIVAWA